MVVGKNPLKSAPRSREPVPGSWEAFLEPEPIKEIFIYCFKEPGDGNQAFFRGSRWKKVPAPQHWLKLTPISCKVTYHKLSDFTLCNKYTGLLYDIKLILDGQRLVTTSSTPSGYQRPTSPSKHYTAPITTPKPNNQLEISLSKSQSAHLSAQSILADLKSQLNHLESDISQTQAANASLRNSRNQQFNLVMNPFLNTSTAAAGDTSYNKSTSGSTGSNSTSAPGWQANIMTNPFLQTTCSSGQQPSVPVSSNPFVQPTLSVQSTTSNQQLPNTAVQATTLLSGGGLPPNHLLSNPSTAISNCGTVSYVTVNRGNPFFQAWENTFC